MPVQEITRPTSPIATTARPAPARAEGDDAPQRRTRRRVLVAAVTAVAATCAAVAATTLDGSTAPTGRADVTRDPVMVRFAGVAGGSDDQDPMIVRFSGRTRDAGARDALVVRFGA